MKHTIASLLLLAGVATLAFSNTPVLPQGGTDAIETAVWNDLPCQPWWEHGISMAAAQPFGNGSAAYGVTFDPNEWDCRIGYQIPRAYIYLCPPPGTYQGVIQIYENTSTSWVLKKADTFDIMVGQFVHSVDFNGVPININSTNKFTLVFYFLSGNGANVFPYWDPANNPARIAHAYTTNWFITEKYDGSKAIERGKIVIDSVNSQNDDVVHPGPTFGDFCMWVDILYHDLEVVSISSPEPPAAHVYDVDDEIPVIAWLRNNSAWNEGLRQVTWQVVGAPNPPYGDKQNVDFVADYNNPAFTWPLATRNSFVVPAEWAGMTKTLKVTIAAGGKYEWNENNNVKSVSFRIAPRCDVKTVSVDVPCGTVVKNVTITPKVTVKNNGSNSITFPLTLNLGAALPAYDRTVNVTLSVGQTKQVSMPTWTPTANGDFMATATATVATDVTPLDNVNTSDFTVGDFLADVGVTSFVSPSGNVERGDAVDVQVAVENFGNTTATFPVVCQIAHDGATYEYRQEVQGLQGGTARTVSFLSRRFRSVGEWSAKAWTEMPNDPNQQNNQSELSFRVTGQAGWYVSYNIPGDVPVNKGAAMANNGSGFYLMKGKKDGKVYGFAEDLDEAKVAGEMPQQAGHGTQMAYLDGVLYVMLANKTFGFYALKDGRWTQLSDLPAGASAKPAKNGASMAVAGSMIYVLKGNKTNEAYRYNPVLNSWEALPNIPSAGGKLAKDGATLTSDGSRVFALLGNKSREFYTFDGAAWQRLADLPANAKAGTALGYMDGMVYAAVGGGVSFYGYDVQMNAWSMLPEVPRVVDTKKVGAGSAMTVVDGSILLVKKAKTLFIMGYSPDSYLCGTAKSPEGVQAATGAVKTAVSVASPVQNVLRLNHTLRGPVYVQLYTSSGSLVRSLTTARSSAELSVSDLASGTYLLKVSSNGQTETRQVIVQ